MGAAYRPMGGFTEICVNVRDVAPLADAFVEIGGYSRLDCSPDEVVLTAEGETKGGVRLLRCADAAAIPVRAGGRAWDPGHTYNIGLYVRDLNHTWRQLVRRGWVALGQPVSYGWGGFEVDQALVAGPDGLTLSLMKPRSAPLSEFPDYRHWSRTFNTAQVVRDYAAAMAFYRDVLGWLPLVDTEVVGLDEPGREILGLPMPWGRDQQRLVGIVHPDGTNDGSVEIFAFPGVDGVDFSSRAGPEAHLGVASTRVRVEGIEAYRDAIAARGGNPGSVETVEIRPLGTARRFFIASPDSAIIEFFELG